MALTHIENGGLGGGGVMELSKQLRKNYKIKTC